MAFLDQATKVLGQITKHLNTITSGGRSGHGGDNPDILGGGGGAAGIIASLDSWGSKTLDVLTDMNRGIWSLVNAIGSGHMGNAGGGLQPPTPFEPLMPPNPQPNPNPPGPKPPKDDGIFTQISSWLGKVLPSFTDSRGSRGIATGLDATSDLVKNIPGVGEPASKVLDFVSAVSKATDKLKEWGNSLHDNNMRFAEFSGAMAAVQARDEMRQIAINRERGDRLAPSAEYNAQAKSRLERTAAKSEDAYGALGNYITGGLQNAMATVREPLDELVKQTAEAMGLLKKPDGLQSNFEMWKDWIGFDGIDNYGVTSDQLKGKGGS